MQVFNNEISEHSKHHIYKLIIYSADTLEVDK